MMVDIFSDYLYFTSTILIWHWERVRSGCIDNILTCIDSPTIKLHYNVRDVFFKSLSSFDKRILPLFSMLWTGTVNKFPQASFKEFIKLKTSVCIVNWNTRNCKWWCLTTIQVRSSWEDVNKKNLVTMFNRLIDIHCCRHQESNQNCGGPLDVSESKVGSRWLSLCDPYSGLLVTKSS